MRLFRCSPPAWEDQRFPRDVRRLLRVAGIRRVAKYAGRHHRIPTTSMQDLACSEEDARVDTITEARMAELRAQADEFLNQPVDHFPAEERCRRHGR